MKVTIVIPMCNEEENARNTVEQVKTIIDKSGNQWEILVIDDGSVDKTAKVIKELARNDDRIKIISHSVNCGRGRALKTGFINASGDIIVTIDADLSYTPEHITRLIEELQKDTSIDIVLGSPYMVGGRAKNIPFHRIFLSKMGNRVLRFALSSKLHTFTGILRAYRKNVINSMLLESDGKELYLEIVSKAIALGYNIKEIPATLTGRSRGKSKFKFKDTAISHLLFSFYEKPAIIFGALGAGMLLIGLGIGIHLILLWHKGILTSGRPLFTLLMILIIGGAVFLSFGFIGTQIAILRKEIYKLQRNSNFPHRDISNNEHRNLR